MTDPRSTAIDAASLLKQAKQAVRRGDVPAARTAAMSGLAGKPADPAPFHAFLGMVSAQSGDLPAAANHLHHAHQLKPRDITVACNLIAVLIDLGRQDEALSVASAELAAADASLRVARYRAFLAQQLEDFPAAVAAYEFVIEQQPDNLEVWNNLGNAQSGAGDLEKAVAALRRAVALDPAVAPTQLNLATTLIALDRTDEARQVLERSVEEFPDDARPPLHLYELLKTLQQQDEALAALLAAAERDPGSPEIQLKLGIEHGVLRHISQSEKAYRRAIELDPSLLDAYLGLAIQLEHTNRPDAFAPLIAQARANGIAPEPLAFIEALDLRRTGNFAEALARLELVPADIEPIRTVHLRATLLDRLGRTDEAFAAFAHANGLMEESPSDPIARAGELRNSLAEEIKLLTPEWRESWCPVEVQDDRDDPVFLVGFPRSGTTLLDTILMGHPDAVVMEEQPPLNLVEAALGGMAAIPTLDSATVAEARAHYFAEAEKIQPLGAGRLLVDKSPLFLYRLPLIQRLFPKAKVILALRHPCDVALSCFMSNFRLNSAMSNFLRLEDTVEFYDLCFGHWQAARRLFPEADVHTVMYEKLVENVEAEVRPLIDWLGLSWEESLLDHRATAKSRGLITTASYSQVTEPIYRRAAGRWRRYQTALQPVLWKLGPWVDHFGYGDHQPERV